MKHRTSGFPIVVGLITTETKSDSEEVLEAIDHVFRKIRDISSSEVWLICSEGSESAERIARLANKAGLSCHSFETETEELGPGELTRAAMELIDASNVILLISREFFGDDIVAYAREADRLLIRIDPTNPATLDPLPDQIDDQSGWLADIFAAAGLSPQADLKTIQIRTDELANHAAPVARGWWKWIVFLQGLAVCVPLAWLTQRFLGLPSLGFAGAATLCAALMLMTAIWWLRWRGMQKTWARSRLVAEAARSFLATTGCSDLPSWRSLALVPSLHPLRWIASQEQKVIPFTEWRDAYVKNRIDDQEEYFSRKQTEAEARRKQFSRWTTILLDIVLALAVFGAVMAFLGRRWLVGLPGDFLTVVFGIGGATFAIGLLLIQILRDIQDLNRRTARYAQQRQMLRQARLQLVGLQSAVGVSEVIENTESKLLAEVLEWYFHAETAENFAGIREVEGTRVVKPLRTTRSGPGSKLTHLILERSGVAGLFILRVIFGRLPVMLIAGAAAVAWISYHAQNLGSTTNQLERTVHLENRDAAIVYDQSANIIDSFDPTPKQAENGCIVFVHGLYGAAATSEPDKTWMKDCGEAIANRMKAAEPAICLVDWSEAARPTKFFNFRLGTEKNLVADVFAIRPQAYAVGDYVATRLAELINENRIRRDRPLHLVGHSAGGFIVARIARRLSREGFVSDKRLLRVTILDTPEADAEILRDLPKAWPTDFCLTSNVIFPLPFGKVQKAKKDIEKHPGSLDLTILSENYQKVLDQLNDPCAKKHSMGDLKSVNGFWQRIWASLSSKAVEFAKAHRSACSWFRLTIECPEKYPDEGFNRSPLVTPVNSP